MTFKVITDATADLPEEIVSSHALDVMDMEIAIGDESFHTIGEKKLTTDKLLAKLATGQRAVTSAVGTGEAQEIFTKYTKEETEILYLAFSSGLSGTFQSVNIAREAVLEEYPRAQITVVDSLAAASGEGYLLEEILKLQEAGKSVEEVLETIRTLIPRLKSWFMVDDLNFLARGGRISKTTALVGTMANIKPVLDVDSTGHLRSVSKARGTKKALNILINNTLDDLDENYPRIIVAHSAAEELAEWVKSEFLAAKANLNIDIRNLGPVISAHTGAGTIAIFSMGKTERQ